MGTKFHSVLNADRSTAVLDSEAIVDLLCDFSYLCHVFNLLKIFICQSIAVIEENKRQEEYSS